MSKDPTRTCRYGHGALERVDGWFAMAELAMERRTDQASQLSVVVVNGPTGRHLVLQAWKCPMCGYLELQDVEL